jgi:N-methylhydantoinase A
MTDRRLLIGVDTGGTFTDVVLATIGDGVLATAKVPTDPANVAASVLSGVQEVLASSGSLASQVERIVHGTTIATNLVLERRGARVAYVGTEGFEQIPLIGREIRGGGAEFDLTYEKPYPLVDAESLFGVAERVSATGEVVTPLTSRAASQIAHELSAGRYESVAVCLLNSYANPLHEQMMADAIHAVMPDCYVALSSTVWPSAREYDRSMTTIVSAYIGPGTARYLDALERLLHYHGLKPQLEVMESHGGVGSVGHALARPVSLLESGPAAGVLAAIRFGEQINEPDLISFDMGGTTAKAGLVLDGSLTITSNFSISTSANAGASHDGMSLPVRAPVVDLAEVGAGGGSIATVDDWGVLKVGPRSAGAYPGPACYGRGGTLPTVTDADLVLGFLGAGGSGDGALELSLESAVEAIEAHIARPMGVDVFTAARGIADVVDAAMGAAVRLVTIARGIDPRRLTLVGFGGAGPSHVLALAEQFGVRRVAVPSMAGVMSAVGLISADIVHDVGRSVRQLSSSVEGSDILEAVAELETVAGQAVTAQAPGVALTLHRSVDMRYRHQAHDVSVPLVEGAPDEILAAMEADFRRLHKRRFGVESDDPVEIVGIRVRAVADLPRLAATTVPHGSAASNSADVHGVRRVQFRGYAAVDTPIYLADHIGATDRIVGPALIQSRHSCLAVPPEWQVSGDGRGGLVGVRAEPGVAATE